MWYPGIELRSLDKVPLPSEPFHQPNRGNYFCDLAGRSHISGTLSHLHFILRQWKDYKGKLTKIIFAFWKCLYCCQRGQDQLRNYWNVQSNKTHGWEYCWWEYEGGTGKLKSHVHVYWKEREGGERERFVFHSQEYSGHSTRFFSLKKLAMGIGRLSLPGTARGKDIGMALASRGWP